MQKTTLPLATEGFPFILFSGFVTVVLALVGLTWLAMAGILATAFVT